MTFDDVRLMMCANERSNFAFEFHAELVEGCKFKGDTSVVCQDYDAEGDYIKVQIALVFRRSGERDRTTRAQTPTTAGSLHRRRTDGAGLPH